MARWFVYIDGAVAGPLEADELLRLPELVPSSKVCPEGSEEWEALADLDELYAAYREQRGTTKVRARVAVSCAFHPNTMAVVLCKFCQKDLCEVCAKTESNDETGEQYVICRECAAKRATILAERAAERARQEAEKQAELARAAAARARAALLKRVVIAAVVLALLIGGGFAVRKIISLKQTMSAQSAAATAVK